MELKTRPHIEKLRALLRQDYLLGVNEYRSYYSQIITSSKFDSLKEEFFSDYVNRFSDLYRNNPNEEQKAFILDDSKHLLLKARAGTWKTTSLVYKTHFLIKGCGISSNEIAFLAFNRDAAKEINERFWRIGLEDCENAMTWHSFAWRLLSGSGRPEFRNVDDSETERKESIDVIRTSVKSVLEDEKFRSSVMRFLRAEIEAHELEGRKNAEVYESRRIHTKHVWLGWQIFKSRWEKWLGDFFFEHGIAYGYEFEIWRMKDGTLDLPNSWTRYRPDFRLDDFRLITDDSKSNDPFAQLGVAQKWKPEKKKTWIEFWWIDETNESRGVPDDWIKTWKEYKSQMEDKRQYFERKSEEGHTLIEFSIRDIPYGRTGVRESFESLIRKKLESRWIVCQKIPEDRLIAMVVEKHKTRIEKMIEGFIAKCRQRNWSVKDARSAADFAIAECSGESSEKLSAFYDFAIECYYRYLREYELVGGTDYSWILIRATEMLHETGDETISFRLGKNRKTELASLKYLMVDEYQDTATLYHGLIEAVIRHNPNLNIICVGDDWQLINTFSWSDEKYIAEFWKTFFPNWKTLMLRTTWRCPQNIVDTANELMDWTEVEWMVCWNPDMPWVMKGWHVNLDEWVKTYQEIKDSKNPIDVACLPDKEDDFMERRDDFLETKILLEWINNALQWWLTPSDIMVLSRKNLEESKKEYVQRSLIRFSKQFSDIRIQTVHASKWQEAKCVIILGLDDFPLIHPDYVYNTIFWESLEDVFEEEMRLLYVAITRTRRRLYVMSENPIDSVRIGIVNRFDKLKCNESPKSLKTARKILLSKGLSLEEKDVKIIDV